MMYGYEWDTTSWVTYALSILPILLIGLTVTLKAAAAGFRETVGLARLHARTPIGVGRISTHVDRFDKAATGTVIAFFRPERQRMVAEPGGEIGGLAGKGHGKSL